MNIIKSALLFTSFLAFFCLFDVTKDYMSSDIGSLSEEDRVRAEHIKSEMDSLISINKADHIRNRDKKEQFDGFFVLDSTNNGNNILESASAYDHLNERVKVRYNILSDRYNKLMLGRIGGLQGYLLYVDNNIFQNKWTCLFVSLLFFLGFYIYRIIAFFVFSPITGISPAALLNTSSKGTAKTVKFGSHAEIEINKGRKYFIKTAWRNQIGDNVKFDEHVVYDMFGGKFASWINRMTHIDEVFIEGDTPEKLIISSPDNPNKRLTLLEINDHSGIVLNIDNVICFSDGIKARKQYCFNPNCWLKEQIKYHIFSGTGEIYIYGIGEIDAINNVNTKIRNSFIVGYDSHLKFKLDRTSGLSPYFFGIKELGEISFEGEGVILKQSSSEVSFSNGTSKAGSKFESIVSLISNLFQF